MYIRRSRLSKGLRASNFCPANGYMYLVVRVAVNTKLFLHMEDLKDPASKPPADRYTPYSVSICPVCLLAGKRPPKESVEKTSPIHQNEFVISSKRKTFSVRKLKKLRFFSVLLIVFLFYKKPTTSVSENRNSKILSRSTDRPEYSQLADLTNEQAISQINKHSV